MFTQQTALRKTLKKGFALSQSRCETSDLDVKQPQQDLKTPSVSTVHKSVCVVRGGLTRRGQRGGPVEASHGYPAWVVLEVLCPCVPVKLCRDVRSGWAVSSHFSGKALGVNMFKALDGHTAKLLS